MKFFVAAFLAAVATALPIVGDTADGSPAYTFVVQSTNTSDVQGALSIRDGQVGVWPGYDGDRFFTSEYAPTKTLAIHFDEAANQLVLVGSGGLLNIDSMSNPSMDQIPTGQVAEWATFRIGAESEVGIFDGADIPSRRWVAYESPNVGWVIALYDGYSKTNKKLITVSITALPQGIYYKPNPVPLPLPPAPPAPLAPIVQPAPVVQPVPVVSVVPVVQPIQPAPVVPALVTPPAPAATPYTAPYGPVATPWAPLGSAPQPPYPAAPSVPGPTAAGPILPITDAFQPVYPPQQTPSIPYYPGAMNGVSPNPVYVPGLSITPAAATPTTAQTYTPVASTRPNLLTNPLGWLFSFTNPISGSYGNRADEARNTPGGSSSNGRLAPTRTSSTRRSSRTTRSTRTITRTRTRTRTPTNSSTRTRTRWFDEPTETPDVEEIEVPEPVETEAPETEDDDVWSWSWDDDEDKLA